MVVDPRLSFKIGRRLGFVEDPVTVPAHDVGLPFDCERMEGVCKRWLSAASKPADAVLRRNSLDRELVP